MGNVNFFDTLVKRKRKKRMATRCFFLLLLLEQLASVEEFKWDFYLASRGRPCLADQHKPQRTLCVQWRLEPRRKVHGRLCLPASMWHPWVLEFTPCVLLNYWVESLGSRLGVEKATNRRLHGLVERKTAHGILK